jgi:hypothetical protein
MEHFVRVIMERSDLAQKLDESIFPNNTVYESDRGATVVDIPLPRKLTEEEADAFADRLSNYLFDEGYDDFDIEISSDEEPIDEETYDGDDFFLEYGVMWFNEDDKYTKIIMPYIDAIIDALEQGKAATKENAQISWYRVAMRVLDKNEKKPPYARPQVLNTAELTFPRAFSVSDHQDAGKAEEFIQHLKNLKQQSVNEAEYQGRSVPLGKPMQGNVKKFKVYVRKPGGNVVKVNFGDPDMKIKKSNPARRRSFRARHNCDNPGPRHKARYWSCRKW